MDQMDHVKEDLFGFFIGKCSVWMYYLLSCWYSLLCLNMLQGNFFRQQHSNNFDDALTTIYSPLCCFCMMTHQFKRRTFRLITRVTNVSGEIVRQSWKCPCQCCYQCVPHTSVVLCLFLFYWKCHTTSHWVFVYFDLAALFARHRVEGWRETEVVPGQDLAGGAGRDQQHPATTLPVCSARAAAASRRAGRCGRGAGERVDWLCCECCRAECWRVLAVPSAGELGFSQC